MKKLNANTVGGAAHSDPLNQKGITLIALIITIIVMLILVGVTINVAFNGGLFEKAATAATGTEKQAIYEQIVSNMELTNDGKISVKGTFDKVVAEFGEDKVTNINPTTVDINTTEVTFSVIGKTGTYNYKISTREIEKDPVQSPSQTSELVYGKMYKGTISEGDETFDYSLCFYENLGIVVQNGEVKNCSLFSYNQENRTIGMYDGLLVCSLAEDGKTMSLEYTEEQVTLNLQLTDEEVNYSPEYLSEFGVYTGLYYNENNNEEKGMIVITTNQIGYINLLTSGYIDGPLSTGVVIDEKHVKYNEEVYTLIESLE